MGAAMGVIEAIVALLAFLAVVLALRAFLQKKAPEGTSNDITNGDSML